MILDAGLDPARDLSKIVLAGSHVASLTACAEGRVDAAAASFLSMEKAVNEKKLAADALRPLAKSEPIPNPPLALAGRLPAEIKKKLKEAFGHVHEAPGITPEMIRGYGGVKVDRYDASYAEAEFLKAAEKLARIDGIKADVLKKASQ
jgi:phosphonate transport system substrate-binding protein